MNNQITIKKLCDKDIESCLLIERESYKNPWIFEHFIYELNNPHSISFTICKDNELIGYLVTHLIIDQIFILNLAIKEQYRCKGYALKLLQTIMEFAINNSVKELHLEVRKSNRAAQSLYLKDGFKLLGERRNFYSDGESALLMVKKLE